MKTRYDKEDDVLMIWFSKKPIDDAKQSKNIITHYSVKKEVVLVEILNASTFLKHSIQTTSHKMRRQTHLNM